MYCHLNTSIKQWECGQVAQLGPGCTGQIFVCFTKKNLSPVPRYKYAWWLLDLPNFVRAYQTSKMLSSCLCLKREIWQIVNLHTMIWRKMSIKKIWSLFLVRVLQPKAFQNYFVFAWQSNNEDGKFAPPYAAWWSLLRIQLLQFPSFHSSCISRAKYCLIFTSLCKLTKYISICRPPESAEYKYSDSVYFHVIDTCG